MKATELRIGNFVDWNGEIAKIAQILELDVVFKCGEMDLTTSIKPIPLTDEILRDWCRMKEELPGLFYREEDVEYTQTGFLSGFIISRFWRKDGKYTALNCGRLRDIEYLHQLQNLYHALKDKELQINIPKA